MSKSEAVGSMQDRADALWRRMKPQVMEVLERHRPERTDLKFDEIESNSASVGDLIARMLIQEALKQQAAASDAEIAASRQELAQEAAGVGKSPEDLRLTRIPDRPCELSTLRGPVPHTREYLHFPELKTGIFPPR